MLGVIGGEPALADEAGALLDGARSTGAGTSSVLVDVFGRQGVGPYWVISDHNGENYRAMDWGHAVARLAGHGPDLADPAVWYPAMSLGDTGAASGAVALCLATAGFERGYAPSASAAVLSVAEGGGRAAVLVRGPLAA